MQLTDCKGAAFLGTKAELKTHNAKLRKRDSRDANARLDVPLPKGTADALARVMAAGGYDRPAELVAMMVHKLDRLRESDEFAGWMTGTLDKWLPLIGGSTGTPAATLVAELEQDEC